MLSSVEYATLGCGKCKVPVPVPGNCTISAALRQQNWKLIVGMFAKCAKAPQDNSTKEDTQRMCGWWNPSGAVLSPEKEEQQRQKARSYPDQTEHPVPVELVAESKPAAFQSGEWSKWGGFVDPSTGLPDEVVLFDMSSDPNEHTDVAAQNPDVVKKMIARLEELRRSEWHDPQWPSYSSCDTTSTPGVYTGDCALQKAPNQAAAKAKGRAAPWLG